MIVVDASVVVAALVGGGRGGPWAEETLISAPLAAPHLLHVEVADSLRRLAAGGRISDDVASIAHSELLDLAVATFDYESLAGRVWDLRAGLSAYDAWYVALAERLNAPLATLDGRLANAPGVRCEVLTLGAS